MTIEVYRYCVVEVYLIMSNLSIIRNFAEEDGPEFPQRQSVVPSHAEIERVVREAHRARGQTMVRALKWVFERRQREF